MYINVKHIYLTFATFHKRQKPFLEYIQYIHHSPMLNANGHIPLYESKLYKSLCIIASEPISTDYSVGLSDCFSNLDFL